MKQAKVIFLAAGMYGIVVLVPMFFAEAFFDRSGEGFAQFYYGFLTVGLAWQLAFIQIGRDPVRLNPVMPFAVCEKAFYLAAMGWLLASGRLHPPAQMQPGTIFLLAMDALWGALFVLAFLRTRADSHARSIAKL